ncbi:MAG: hypothetical protein LBE13_04315 [Bacteroidales bacterium]|jgi:hypothetical protein|nr:hypothetical protein [Bacteroidales bacterium]
MYKEIKNIQNTNGLYFIENRLYTFIDLNKSLSEFDVFGNLLWIMAERDIYYRYYVNNEIIIFSQKDKNSGVTFLDRKTKKILKQESEYLNITNLSCYNNNLLYSLSKGELKVYDLKRLICISSTKKNMIGIVQYITNQFIITNDYHSVFAYSKTDFSLVWQQDLKEALKYHFDKKDVYGQIKHVKQYKDSVIVVSDGGIIRLLLATGETVWKSKTYAQTMEIVKETGFICSGLCIYKIDLETGKINHYGWEHNKLPDFEYNGKKYWAVGHEVIYHDGLLWYSVYSSGESFITAINPENGNYEWIHHVETYEKIQSPRFYGDKMFLLDTGGTLHIYEKEK